MLAPTNATLIARAIYTLPDGRTYTVKLKHSSSARRTPARWVEQITHDRDGHPTATLAQQYAGRRLPQAAASYRQLTQAAETAGHTRTSTYPHQPPK